MYALNGRQIRNVVMAAQAYASQSLNLGELENKVMALTHQAGPGYENTLDPSYPAYGTGALAGSVGPGYGAAGPGYGGYGPPGGGQFGGGYGNNAVANMGGYSPVPRREDGRMTADHLRAVCELTREFQEQLKEESKDQRYANEAR